MRSAASVDFGAQAQALYATDASNYRQVPLGVVYPRAARRWSKRCASAASTTHRSSRAAAAPASRAKAATSRWCIDFSRHLHRVVEIDAAPERRVSSRAAFSTAPRCGCPHGLTFGPDPATHDHNTLGGMVGNDSCGVHSVKWGRALDNVGRLDVLTYDGLQLELGPTPERARAPPGRVGRRGEIYRALVSLRIATAVDRGAISQNSPACLRFRRSRGAAPRKRLQRRQGGDRHRRDVRHCAGSRETGARPESRAIALLSFDDVYAAADAVPALLEQQPDGSRASTQDVRAIPRSAVKALVRFPKVAAS